MEVWKTSEGDEIPLEKMTDKHLQNAYAYVGRRLEANSLKDEVIYDVEVEPPAPEYADLVSQLTARCSALRIQADADRAWRTRFEREAARRGLELKRD
jgi:hypothetical protein